MEDLVEKLGFDRELVGSLEALIENKKDRICRLSEKCRSSGFKALKKESDLMKLAVCLDYAKYTRELYKERNIDDEIFYDTLGDIVIWCENNGNRGLKNIMWIKNHLNAELFRIGRLQFQFFTNTYMLFNYSKLPFNYGDKMIFIHIPQGEKLIYEDCVKSIAMAKEFFAKHFPEYEYKFFFCESWLLFEDNKRFMKPSSNILQFQTLFEIISSIKIEQQAIERIFGKRHIIKARYPEKTSLQKSAKEYIRKGNKMGIGIGIINKDYI